MKKILLIAGLLSGMNSIAQDYYHGAGLGFNVANYKLVYTSISTGDFEDNTIAALPFIYYKATLGWEINRSNSFGLSAYPGAGAFIDTRDESGSNYVGFQLPIMAEMYFGDMDDNNFNIGAGFALNTILTADGGGSVVGPQIALGGHFVVSDNLIGIRAYFVPGIGGKSEPGIDGFPADAKVSKDSRMLFGGSIHYMFGQ